MDQEFKPKNHSNTWTIVVVCAFVGVIFITATFIWQQIKMQENLAALTKLVASKISVAPTSNVNTAEVISEDKNNSDWQTYTFKDAGYSIDLPKDWVAYSPYDGKAYPLSEEKYGGAFSVGPADTKSYVSIEVSKHSSTNFDILELYKKNTVADYKTVSGLTGYVVSNFTTPGATIKKVYLFKKDNVSYSFRVSEETADILEIINSLKLLN